MIYVGIDNGLTGGLCAISEHAGFIINHCAMPVTKREKKRNEVNIRAVHLWLSEVTGGNLSNAVYVIEEPNNSRNPSTAYSVASSFHSLRGFFETKMLNWHRITPQSWQKSMLGKFPAGESKVYSLAKARELWTNETFYASPRCKTPHDGIVDAALIARYARKIQL
jgi:hypothetical protein